LSFGGEKRGNRKTRRFFLTSKKGEGERELLSNYSGKKEKEKKRGKRIERKTKLKRERTSSRHF